MRDKISIAGLEAESGKKEFGYLHTGETPSGSLQLPFGVINGKNDGPVLLVMAGTQACEYAGIDAAVRIFSETNPEKIRGAVLTVPVLNVVGFDRATPVVSPVDGLNMAFQFPGDPNGSLSQVTARIVWEKLATRANFVLDLHGGDINELLVPYSIFYRTGNESVDKTSLAMAKMFGTEYIEERTSTGGGKLWPVSMLFVEACKHGKPSIVAESGMLGGYGEEDVFRHVNAVRNVMKLVRMIDGEPSKVEVKQKLWSEVREVAVRRGGLFYLTAKLGQPVSEGEKLGYLRNLRGEIVEEVLSPSDGFVLLVFHKHVVYTGEVVVILGTNVREL